MTTTMTSPLTASQIESVIGAMPIQGRIMLRLILLQYFDVTEEEIHYITADRPDPRCVAGTKPTYNILTQEAIKAVKDRRDQYRRQVRLKRERTWLQCECLRSLADLREGLAARATELLTTRFAVAPDALEILKSQARSALPRPAIRALDARWDANEITAEEYQRQRLSIELQTQLRLAEKYRKRLDLAERERLAANVTPLQDHELGHIWGIPAGSLAARKVKYIAQYLQSLQTAVQGSAKTAVASTPPIDLWKETFAVLATGPIERSLSTYDGLERTESALIDKLTELAWGNLTEDIEPKFWLSLVQGASSNALHSEATRNLFGLQRLAAILKDLDTSPQALDEALLARVTPRAHDQQVELLEKKPADSEPDEMREHVLRSMFGEPHPDLTGGGKW